MPQRLDATSPNFATQFDALLHQREADEADVSTIVRDIMADVRREGDAAILRYTQQFDALTLCAESMRVSPERIEQAQRDCPADIIAALTTAAARIRSYHDKQLPDDKLYTDDTGTQLGWRWNAIDAVGLYVPGGRASYPSSVLMNAIPARVAGVHRLVMVVPTPNGDVNPAIFVAAQLAQVDEIYTIGGAQAIAALAYGTASIAAVDMIVGPGNAYVAEAKRQVFGHVGIDMIAGPSEIVVLADAQNNPDWIAADLLSQAEHDPTAQSILFTDDAAFAQAVCDAVERTLQSLSRQSIAAASWRDYGAVITVPSLDGAIPLINRLAPEHLELAVDKPESYLHAIRHAGAIFMGRHTPEAIGDYIAGPSHVLPTSRTARFSSGLSVYHFIKKTSLIGCSAASIQAIGPQAEALAHCEGLSAHALSITKRLE